MTITQMKQALNELFETYAYDESKSKIEIVRMSKFEVLTIRTKDPTTDTMVSLSTKIFEDKEATVGDNTKTG